MIDNVPLCSRLTLLALLARGALCITPQNPTSLRHGSVRVSRFLDPDAAGDVKHAEVLQLYDKDYVNSMQESPIDVESARKLVTVGVQGPACRAALPSICGIKYLNSTDESLYNIRLENRFQELQLPGTASLKRGEKIIITSEDLTSTVFPGAVLRIGSVLPLLVSSATKSALEIADPYFGADLTDAPIFAVNLQLTPGVFDAKKGSIVVTPSVDGSSALVDPYAVVPATILAATNVNTAPITAAAQHVNTDQGALIGTLRAGDHVVFAGVVGGVVDTMVERADVKGGNLVLTAFSIHTAFPHDDVHQQRVYRFINEEFPGIAPFLVARWRSRRSQSHPERPAAATASGEEDADNIIANIKTEANALYSQKDDNVVMAAVAGGVGGQELPGTVSTTHGSPVISVSCDITRFIATNDVVRIHTFIAFTVIEINKLADDSCTVVLDIGFPGPSLSGVPIYLLPEARQLPATATLTQGGATLTTTANLVAFVKPRSLLLVATAPPLFVVVQADRHVSAKPVTPTSVSVDPPYSFPQAGPATSLRIFDMGYTALYDKQGDLCKVTVQRGNAKLLTNKCDITWMMRSRQDILLGLPDSWMHDRKASIPAGRHPSWLISATQEGASHDVVGAEHILLDEPYAGPSEDGLIAFTAFSLVPPGTATLRQDSAFVETNFDPRPYFQSGDLVRVGNLPAFIVAGGGLATISLSSTKSITVTGSSNDAVLGVAASGFYITDVYAGGELLQQGLRKLRYRVVPGRASLATGSDTVYTSIDSRQYITAGTCLAVAPANYIVVAQSSAEVAKEKQVGAALQLQGAVATSAVTSSKLTLREAVQFDESSSHGSVSIREPDFLYSACPILPVPSMYAMRQLADAKSFRAWYNAKQKECIEARNGGDERKWRPLLVDNGCPSPTFEAATSNGAPELAVKQLPGTVSVIAGSAIVTTTSDLSDYLGPGDVVLVGAHPATFVIAMKPSPTTFQLTVVYPGATASGLALGLQYRRIRLASTLDVTTGSPTATSHSDLRGMLAVGDKIEIVATVGGTVAVREFNVMPPISGTQLTLSEAYPGGTESGCAAFKLIGGAAPGLLLPGTVTANQGSNIVTTTEDLSGSIRAGDRIRITTVDVVASEPINSQSFTIIQPYPGSSGAGLRAYNLGRTSQQLNLEQLARLKLQCRSIFCLAKIEELERAVPSDLTRSLNVAALLPAVSSTGGTVENTRDALLAQQAAAEAAIEKEWQAWYEKARTQLNIADAWASSPGAVGVMQAARDGAGARVAELYGSGQAAS